MSTCPHSDPHCGLNGRCGPCVTDEHRRSRRVPIVVALAVCALWTIAGLLIFWATR